MLWKEFNGFIKPKNFWRDFDDLSRSLSRFENVSSVEFPAAKVWISKDSTIISAEIPGVESQDVDITVSGNLLKLHGFRRPQDITEGERYHKQERWEGEFTRNFELPYTIDKEKVEAQFNKGRLIINLQCAETDKPKKIPVKSE